MFIGLGNEHSEIVKDRKPSKVSFIISKHMFRLSNLKIKYRFDVATP